MIMTVLLVWSLVDIEAPRLITSDNQVIDLLANNPIVWQQHISPENIRRILEQVHRWKVAVEAGASAIDAYGYAINGNGYGFSDWIHNESSSHTDRIFGC
jgi:hypothetical protein